MTLSIIVTFISTSHPFSFDHQPSKPQLRPLLSPQLQIMRSSLLSTSSQTAISILLSFSFFSTASARLDIASLRSHYRAFDCARDATTPCCQALTSGGTIPDSCSDSSGTPVPSSYITATTSTTAATSPTSAHNIASVVVALAATAAASSTPAISADVYRHRAQSAVNLGAWFVAEEWMTWSRFDECAQGDDTAEINIAMGCDQVSLVFCFVFLSIDETQRKVSFPAHNEKQSFRPLRRVPWKTTGIRKCMKMI